MEGVLYALVPMVTWGSLGLVSNKIGGDANQQTFGLTLGALVFATGLYLINQPVLDWQLLVFGVIGGFLWSVGQNNQFKAMQYMGVSVAQPLSSGSQLVIGSLIGVLVFKEWTKPIQFALGAFAMICLLLGFYFFSKQDKEAVRTNGSLYDFSRGFRVLVFSTLGYLSYTILFNNVLKFDALAVIFPMSLGMVLGASAFMNFKVRVDRIVLKNAWVGILWSLGNVFMLLAANSAGLAIAFSFSQLGAVISIVGGVIFLGEKKTPREMHWLVLGLVFFILGAILLGVVKAY